MVDTKNPLGKVHPPKTIPVEEVEPLLVQSLRDTIRMIDKGDGSLDGNISRDILLKKIDEMPKKDLPPEFGIVRDALKQLPANIKVDYKAIPYVVQSALRRGDANDDWQLTPKEFLSAMTNIINDSDKIIGGVELNKLLPKITTVKEVKGRQ